MITCDICKCGWVGTQIYGFIFDECKNLVPIANEIKDANLKICEDCIESVTTYSKLYRQLEEKVSNFRYALKSIME